MPPDLKKTFILFREGEHLGAGKMNDLTELGGHHHEVPGAFDDVAGLVAPPVFHDPRPPVLFIPDVDIAAYGVMVPKEDIPAFGFGLIDPRTIPLKTGLATAAAPPVMILNGPNDVTADMPGRGYLAWEYPAWVAYSGSAPSLGDALGVVPSAQAVSTDYAGFRAVSDGLDDKVLVVRDRGGKWPRCNCLAKGAVAAVDATFTVDNVVPNEWGPSPVTAAADELTVTNLFGWAIDDDDIVKIEWNHFSSPPQWEPYIANCPA